MALSSGNVSWTDSSLRRFGGDAKAVRFENRDDRTVDQAAAIDRAHHIVIAVELTDKRNHRFSECFTVDPFTKTLVGLLSHGNLPHEKKKGVMTPAIAGNLQRCKG
jgi:hypothetical protein